MRSFWFLLLLVLVLFPTVHAVGLLVPSEFDSLVRVYTSNSTSIDVSIKGDSSNNTVTFFATSPDARLLINGVQSYSTTFTLNANQVRATTLKMTGLNSTSVLAVDYGFILRSKSSAYFIMDISGLIVNFTASPGVGFRQVTKDTFQAKVCDVVCNSSETIVSSTLPLNESDSTVWFWDFGDGTNSTGRTPTHSYKSSPGSYKVTLTVTDGVSSATSNQAVCVGACLVRPESTPGSSGGGGMVPTSITSTVSGKTFVFGTVLSGVDNVISIADVNIPVTDIVFASTVQGTNVKVVVSQETSSTVTKQFEGTVYKYLSITPSTTLSLSKGKITLVVPLSWLKSSGLTADKVAVYRFVGGVWVVLPTRVLKTSGSDVIFEADTPGFSFFAIGAEKVVNDVISPVLNDVSKESGVIVAEVPLVPSISATSNVAQIVEELTTKGGKNVALVLVGMLISVLVLEIAVYSVAKRMPD